uniref:Rho termination factor N-terminal domain-containing protein n=1 Tax=viral metagenome TaxID=1070528 RepID=A0A6C0HBG0_9ZZZZ
MGLFNYIDTFFFISLGITFILILLLVFHFKQQIASLEHKNDTMFEIINNIVKELNFMKSGYLVNSSQYHCQALQEHNDDTIMFQQHPFQSKQNFENKIVVSDDDSEDEQDSDDDSEDDQHSDDDDTDSEDEEDSEDDQHSDDEVVVVNHNENDVNEIKVINIELGDNIEINDIENDIENENDAEEEEPIQEHFENDTSIVVTKLESEHLESSENTDLVINTTTGFKATKDYYARMTLNELKTMAVTKGLVSDASKMKKIQLIQLLLEKH